MFPVPPTSASILPSVVDEKQPVLTPLEAHGLPPHQRPWPPKPIHVRHRMCCFCLQARYGTMLICLASIVLGAIMAGQSWVVLFGKFIGLRKFNAGTAQALTALDIATGYLSGWLAYVFTLFAAVTWSLLAIFAVFGYIGVWLQRRDFVAMFYSICWWHIWFSVVVGIWSLTALAANPSKPFLVYTCVETVLSAKNIVPDEANHAIERLTAKCEKDTTLWLVFLALLWCACVLVELWLLLTVSRTLDELESWDAAHCGFDLDVDVKPSKYLPVMAKSRGKRERRHHHGHRHHHQGQSKGSSRSKEQAKNTNKWLDPDSA
ncbi:hypothetical protein OIO90_003805 [Microbotryomycetes sp. JL221]|nr:hypothetical protein OIO90_003805 [Microbotryomycetes sp. JL221]